MKILSIVGARPNFMKIAPIIRAINGRNRAEQDRRSIEHIDHILVHTGQHYDRKMSGVFFEDLGLPAPDVCLGVGSGSHAVQTAETMKRFEETLLKYEPDCVVLVGDVNSTVACALTASKVSFNGGPAAAGRRPLIAHVEAGLRSFDREMPEEINRIVTDQLSHLLFVTEQSAVDNLKREGISESGIFFVGNTMIDTLLACRERAGHSKVLEGLRLIPGEYALATIHRPANVDIPEKFREIHGALEEISRKLTVIMPLHPRTLVRIKSSPGENPFVFADGNGARKNRVNAMEPLSYLDFVCMMDNARIVLTDSGGIQEETTCLGVPCVTIRENTERPVTISEGTNALAGTGREGIIRVFEQQLERNPSAGAPRLWDGKAAERIVKVLVEKAAAISPPF